MNLNLFFGAISRVTISRTTSRVHRYDTNPTHGHHPPQPPFVCYGHLHNYIPPSESRSVNTLHINCLPLLQGLLLLLRWLLNSSPHLTAAAPVLADEEIFTPPNFHLDIYGNVAFISTSLAMVAAEDGPQCTERFVSERLCEPIHLLMIGVGPVPHRRHFRNHPRRCLNRCSILLQHCSISSRRFARQNMKAKSTRRRMCVCRFST